MFTPQERVIESIEWDGEDRVTIRTGEVWSGMKRKDFFCPEDDWESRLVPGARLRYWTIQYSRVVGVEWWDGKTWVSVWVSGNNFQTKAEREAAQGAYVAFIESEAKNIAGWIDEGKTLTEINKLVAEGHTGNTHAWALNLGIRDAKNRENAEAVRRAHNVQWGAPEAEGLVNPAVLTLTPTPEARPDGG